jgi:biopolymer transport protein ExbB/biopolymer transport protein TolQ
MEFTLAQLWAHMGLFARMIVIVMGIMSIISLVVAGERLALFLRGREESRLFAQKMGALLAKGDLDAAAAAKLGKEVGYLGRVIGAGLAAYALTVKVARLGGSADKKAYRDGEPKGRARVLNPDLVFESVARALERQAQREAASMKRGLAVLATVSATAPFVGLLGTVMGIVNAFQQMAASGSGGLGTVSGGISEALITTAFGLLVAIPAVMLYNFLQGWVDARTVDIAESSNEFLDVVARELGDRDEAGESSEAA